MIFPGDLSQRNNLTEAKLHACVCMCVCVSVYPGRRVCMFLCLCTQACVFVHVCVGGCACVCQPWPGARVGPVIVQGGGLPGFRQDEPQRSYFRKQGCHQRLQG